MPRQPRPSRLQARETALVVSSYGRSASIHPQGTSPLRAGNPLFFLKEIPMDRSLIKSMIPSLVAGHVPRNVRSFKYRVFDGGNTSGDTWKHVFFPRQREHYFVYEA